VGGDVSPVTLELVEEVESPYRPRRP
jgi:hypothetical protein